MEPMTGTIFYLSSDEAKELVEEHRINSNGVSDQSDRLMSLEKKMVSLTDSEAEKLEPLDKRARKGWMRNQPCPCGSDKKFKHCCWNKFK
jgi:uncharacterized protein YecA (UPF0149 family)